MSTTWREQVIEAVHEAAEPIDADPYVLLESVSFVRSLDPYVDLDGEALTLGVAEAVQEAAGAKPYGDVRYADPGYQQDKKARYPLDTEAHIRAAWTYVNQSDNASQYSPAHLKLVKARIRAAMKRIGAQVTEAVFDPEQHPRADAGTATGGQFSAGGGSAAAPASTVTTTTHGRRGGGKAVHVHKVKPAAAHKGSKGGAGHHAAKGNPHVRTLQTALNRLGATDGKGNKLAVDGKFGPLTMQALKDAQTRLGLPATGHVTPHLLAQLQAIKSLPARATHAEVPDMTDRIAEAVIDGQRTFGEVQDLVRDAVRARARAEDPTSYPYVMVVDISGDQVIYTTADEDDLFQCSYSIGADDAVTLGDPTPVERTYVPTADRNPPEEDEEGGGMDATQEAAHDRIAGRVLEAKGADDGGGRIFGVRIIAFGDSRNGRRYPARVMQEAVSKYEGARAYDHHRTAEELRSSTLTGLIGSYRNVEARGDGLYGDLHLLPGATHAAEALDATLAAQADGRPPIVGVSHDVMAHFQPVNNNGRRLQEATQIVDVQSADVVANPSAGGLAVRAVAGGTETVEESEVAPTKADFLTAFSEATDDELAAVGLARAPSKTTESVTPSGPPTRAVESGQGERTTEAMEYDKTSTIGRLVAKDKLTAAGLAAVSESFIGSLPDRFTEADLDGRITSMKDAQAAFERAGLVPSVTAEVVTESMDKKVKALDAFFAGDFQAGYKSFREAYFDFTGYRPQFIGEDLNRKILRESFHAEYEYKADRATESLSSSSWNLVLGDSITRRLVADYNEPALMDWMRIVSSTPPINDFRTQRIERLGGYGILPAVAQGAPYQPLNSPGNEEATYAIGKRGGTEDVTLEMIANDDVRSISKIPTRLALAAKRTIFGFVFELIRPVSAGVSYMGTTGNPTCTFDSTALYAAGHNNTATNALSQSNLSAARTAMRKQSGFGDTTNILSIVPSLLLVPPTLEELAFQLCSSAVAVPATPAGPSNTPNIHQNLDYAVVDYWDSLSATQWAVVADPNSVPTVEVGFYQGQRDPQLFTQSDQTVGSMFNSDKFTYKIRHIYSGVILDYRGFQRGNS